MKRNLSAWLPMLLTVPALTWVACAESTIDHDPNAAAAASERKGRTVYDESSASTIRRLSSADLGLADTEGCKVAAHDNLPPRVVHLDPSLALTYRDDPTIVCRATAKVKALLAASCDGGKRVLAQVTDMEKIDCPSDALKGAPTAAFHVRWGKEGGASQKGFALYGYEETAEEETVAAEPVMVTEAYDQADDEPVVAPEAPVGQTYGQAASEPAVAPPAPPVQSYGEVPAVTPPAATPVQSYGETPAAPTPPAAEPAPQAPTVAAAAPVAAPVVATPAEPEPEAPLLEFDYEGGEHIVFDDGTVVAPGKDKARCYDVRLALLERKKDGLEKLRPSYLGWARNVQLDPTTGCLAEADQAVARAMRGAVKKLKATIKAQQNRRAQLIATPGQQAAVAVLDGRLKRLHHNLWMYSRRLAFLESAGVACTLPGPFLRRGGVGYDKATQEDKDYVADLKLESGPDKTPLDALQVTATFKFAKLDKKMGPHCGKFTNNTMTTKLKLKDLLSEDKKKVRFALREVLKCNPYLNAAVEIKIAMLDKAGKKVGDSCGINLLEISPLVLDFTGSETLQTIAPAASEARFDLAGDGKARATGWIAPGTGLLALDRDGNGAIDSGRELFGDATVFATGEKAASNGFLALARHDERGKGYVDASDAVFAKLVVWLDDGDGVSKPEELVPLAKLGITRIDTRYENVPEAQRRDGGIFGNDVRYRARFHAPALCGEAGCRIYDVWFGTSVSTAGP